MVKRKPIGQGVPVPAPLQQAVGNPPYPTSPTNVTMASQIPPVPPALSQSMSNRERGLHPESSFELVGHNDVPQNDGAAEEEESDDEWGGDTDDEEEKEQARHDLPASLKPGIPGSREVSPNPSTSADASLPAVLRPGGQALPQQSQVSLISAQSTGSNPWQHQSSEQRPSASFKSNNPFLRTQHSGPGNSPAMESSSSAWAELPAISSPREEGHIPTAVELPADQVPHDAFSQLSLLDPNSPTATHGAALPSSEQAAAPVRPPPIPPAQDFSQEGPPAVPAQVSNVWDDLDHQLASDQATSKELAHMDQATGTDPNPWQSERQPGGEAVPALPPRPSTDDAEPPAMPPRPQVDIPLGSTASRSATESPNTAAQRQRKEHYQIKHIRWHDASYDQLRESPILIQNLNGPCPLLALVNALILSTPPGLNTGLTETLRTREQVSLGLLLDSVFDELMSGRRSGPGAELPDVTELYQFLLTLHTGMNVNPRFVPKVVEAPNLMDADGPVAEVHPALREPGGFEETKEMRLYSTFDVPLIHGWLPSKGSEAYTSFDRSAKTFEEAQNIQFFEEELDERLRDSGLNPEEIRQFEDITNIKEFLSRWPTQLTDYGLDIIKDFMRPASIAIFFRNDHFSTMYKEPKSGLLMGLVTDAGYSTHDEIVWESLTDVNGRNSEFFSGDFRPVGGPAASASASASASAGPAGPRGSSSHAAQEGRTTGAGKRRSTRPEESLQIPSSPRDSGVVLGRQENGVLRVSSEGVRDMPTSPSQAEQEDHDLALALQLQEEEEDRARRERAQRAAENERLNQQYLEADGQVRNSPTPGRPSASGRRPSAQEARPAIPPRRTGPTPVAQSGAPAPLTNRPTGTEGEAPPPSYEQAARRPAFNPPPGHPASASAPVGADGSGRGQQQGGSAYGQNARRISRQFVGQQPGPSGAGRGRGASYGGIGPGYSQPVGDDRDKCIVM